MLSQAKVEHAVLWILVRGDFDGMRADAHSVWKLLDHFSTERVIAAALEHLVAAKYATVEAAPGFRNYVPTRLGVSHIEHLESNPVTFVARLTENGAGWLRDPAAENAKLEAKIIARETAIAEPHPSGSSTLLHVINNVTPVFNNSNTQGTPSPDPVAFSAKTGTWVSAWGAWAGFIAAVVGILVAIMIALNVIGK
ncbi:hypothetical protein [uncultured Sphingomonas sp.]|uniref:hypothetical protein n=1 Tax=uncultured Sphingomonas sp. TaxID=158754 RepID=UPI0025F6F13F|nr:hypothetical protein [uncultured Sphingomonas sp.]